MIPHKPFPRPVKGAVVSRIIWDQESGSVKVIVRIVPLTGDRIKALPGPGHPACPEPGPGRSGGGFR